MAAPIVRMSDLAFNDALYEPISTGDDVIDTFISNRGGFLPSTIIMVVGDPGAGKTTLACKWMADATRHSGARTAFISSEMDQIDFAEYYFRFKEFGDFDIYFVDFDRNIKNDIDDFLSNGYDIVLIDSFKDLQDKIADQENCSKSSAEQWLMQTIMKYKRGYEVGNTVFYTTFLIIQQVLKSGNFAGSNSLKHQITASLKLCVDEGRNFMFFDKNRRGVAGRTIHYSIKNDEIHYDTARLQLEDDVTDIVERHEERVSNAGVFNADAFRNLLAQRNTMGDAIRDAATEAALTPDVVAATLEANDYKIATSLRQLKADGSVPENFTAYRLRKFCDEHGIDRLTYNTNS